MKAVILTLLVILITVVGLFGSLILAGNGYAVYSTILTAVSVLLLAFIGIRFAPPECRKGGLK